MICRSAKPVAFAISVFLLIALLSPTVRADEILVSAASSLTNAMTDIGAAYTKANPGTTVRFNFGASGLLEQQIEQGAPVDVFAAASPKEIDDLARTSKIVAATRSNFAGNRLVLIVAAKDQSQIKVKDWGDLGKSAVTRISISNPASVPSGRYAQETLTRRGIWTSLQPKLVFGTNVRQTLAYVASGDVDAGIVFATDAMIEKRVRVVAEAIADKDHEPIVYPAAVVTSAPNAPGARRFVAFLKSASAQQILKKYGFTAP